MSWTTEAVLTLAPDSESAKAAKGLANKSRWLTLGANDVAVWGECQGSGSKPYQARIDLAEPAFKCSCPSRKFPCKHSLALFLLYAEQNSLFSAGDPPEWVSEWLESRAGRAEKQTRKRDEKAGAPVDPKAQERRQANRLERVIAGLDDLELWLSDVIRAGIASAPSHPYSFWDKPAARLVDAQAPGLARMVRQLAGIASSGNGWPERLLGQLGRMQLLIEAFRRRDALPTDVQADIDTVLGFPIAKEDVLATVPVRDQWLVAGSELEEDIDGMRVSKSWLYGSISNKYALLLNFTHRSQATDQLAQLPVGLVFEAGAFYYPSATPMRVLLGDRTDAAVSPKLPGNYSIEQALTQWRGAVARNPWVMQMPMFVVDVTPVHANEIWIIREESGSSLQISTAFQSNWQLLALSGGCPVDLFGIFDGSSFQPLTIFSDGNALDLAARRS